MEAWNRIITSAMIGTDKSMPGVNDFAAGIIEHISVILENPAIDKEEKFLQASSLLYNYRKCGVQPIRKEEVSLSPAQEEEKSYCNNLAVQVLIEILAEENMVLLKEWLQLCSQKKQIIPPGLLPALLNIGKAQKNLQILLQDCCGKRGEWLGSLNEEWNFTAIQTPEESWQTGNPSQRKEVLRQLRNTEPAKAIEWLLQTWQQEDANTKTSFLEILNDHIGTSDIPFLEGLATEKSKTVKEAALNQLKKIPESQIVQRYCRFLETAWVLKKGKSLLGMINKTAIQLSIPEQMDEELFRSGIQKLSSTKEFSDDEFILFQLVQSVPPSFWEKHFECTPEQAISYFQKDNVGKKMMPALVRATVQFGDQHWANSLMQHSETTAIDLIPLLSIQQQEYYSAQHFENFPEQVIKFAVSRDTAWGLELGRKILRYAAKNPYQFGKNFFAQQIHLLPPQIIGELEKFTPAEEHLRTTWSNNSEYLLKLISLKIQFINAFNE